MRLPTLCLVSVVALAGCYPYIGKSLEEERAASLDEDGDSFPASEDCNDNDATINPEATEVAYDGIDQNCDNPAQDLVDVDGDGFPGILQADYERLGDVPPWPNDVAPGPLDCDDNDNTIFPGAPDVPYNGIDEDCAADCDFNTDGDRFADKSTAAESANDPACSEFPATDCLDTNENAFPGNPAEDVPYDGIDLNCDGVNDFDPDGDNAVWATYQEDYNRYLTAHNYTSSNPTFDECYDVLDGALPQTGPVDPGTVSSAVVETFGDGIDGDCSDMTGPIANDFDEDGDGYMPTASRANFLAYVERYINYENHLGETPYKVAFTQAFGGTSAEWAGFFDTWQNDCDDTDATRNPEAIEVLGDAIDQDC
ncbi:MAG: putative metal-binding motif-containing protein, partial [Myxococcota bacterium]